MSEATDIEIDAATKAHRDLGNVSVDRKSILGSEKGSNILDTYEQAENASRDALTGLFNRGYFDKVLRNKIDEGSVFSLIIVDVDEFKKFNDTYGHETGDGALINVARTLSGFLRLARPSESERDVVARWGGEEFAIILSGVDDELQAKTIADELRVKVSSSKIHVEGDSQVSITISAGVALSHPTDTPREIFKRADKGLYLAKENGRNRVEIFKS